MKRLDETRAIDWRPWHALLTQAEPRWYLRSAQPIGQSPWLLEFIKPTAGLRVDSPTADWLDTITEIVVAPPHIFWVRRLPGARHEIWRTTRDRMHRESATRDEFLRAKEQAFASRSHTAQRTMPTFDFRPCEAQVSALSSRSAATEPPDFRRVVLVSIHGWFAQRDVLGRPDTGGQVIFVLEQARALAQALPKAQIVIVTRQILDAEGTHCDQTIEQLADVQNGRIVRIPFYDEQGTVVRPWISRYQVWPYLNRFVADAADHLTSELGGVPDLVVGHAADGNWVAMHLGQRFGCAHLACAHWLEKPKYRREHNDWSRWIESRQIPVQFLGELIAYHHADAIVASSAHEIRGTREIAGPWESYDLLTLPPYYRVTHGIDITSNRFSIIPPGVDETAFYPACPAADATASRSTDIADMFAAVPRSGQRGVIADPSRPWIVALARLDPAKNISGLVEIFATSSELRATCNLLMVTSVCHIEQATDAEEREEVARIEQLWQQYSLPHVVRWCGTRLSRSATGELYREVAARHGCLAQPALMEHFGLTIIEAMACGLPTVVTNLGGPAEIVGNGAWGEIADPRDASAFAAAILRLVTDRRRWQDCVDGGLQQVSARYRWRHHAQELLRVALAVRAAQETRSEARAARAGCLASAIEWINAHRSPSGN